MATVCALFHSSLAPNNPCPFCHHINNPLGAPAALPAPQTPPTKPSTPPVAPGTVAALRQTIGTGNAYRAAKAAASSVTALGPPSP